MEAAVNGFLFPDLGNSRFSAFPEGKEDFDNHTLVTLEWDTCSPDYILVAYRGGALLLVDVNTMRVITKYILPVSASISTLAWLPDAPGMFVTGGTSFYFIYPIN